MDDSAISNTPAAIPTILSETRALGFDMISEPRVDLLLAGMDASATLDTVDNDPRVVAVAQRHLGADPRIRFHIKDGGQFLQEPGLDPFDLSTPMPGPANSVIWTRPWRCSTPVASTSSTISSHSRTGRRDMPRRCQR
jgi:hypothetical protein